MSDYKNVLIGYPAESGSIKFLENALSFAKIMDAQVDVAYITEPLIDTIYYLYIKGAEISPQNFWSEERNRIRKDFIKDMKAIESKLDVTVNLKMVEGSPAQTILDMSPKYSLVIINASRESENVKNHLGPTARIVVHQTKKPVLVLSELHEKKRLDIIQNILVPVDGSNISNFAVAHAGLIADKLNGTINLLHVWEKKYEKWLMKITRDNIDIIKLKDQICKIILDEAENKMITKEQVKRDIIDGEPSDVIVSESEKYDLIVMGTHGRSGIKKFLLGSNAENVAQHVDIPVLLVHSMPD